MKGYKDSTRTVYYKGGSTKGAKGAAKVASVMREFKEGTLHSGSDKGPKVRNPKQAIAIALSEARRRPMKKAEGGRVDMAQDKKTVAAGVHKHERAMHPGKPMTKMQRGGAVPATRRDPLIKC